MKANRAFFSGLLGGIVVTILMALFRGLGLIQLDFERLLGTLTSAAGMSAWITGFFFHLLLAGVFALVYGEYFERLGRAGLWPGLAAGLAQAFVVGLLLAALPAVHPRLAAPPGFFAAGYGPLDTAALLVVHLVYGALLGLLYQTPLRAGAGDYART